MRFRHWHWDRMRDWLLRWWSRLVCLLAFLSWDWLWLLLLLGRLWDWAGLWGHLMLLGYILLWLRCLRLWAGLCPLRSRSRSGFLVYRVITSFYKDGNVSHHTWPLSTPRAVLLSVLLLRILLLTAELPLLVRMRRRREETEWRLLLWWLWCGILLWRRLLLVLLWVWLLVLLVLLWLGVSGHERPGDCVEFGWKRGILRGSGWLWDSRRLWSDADLGHKSLWLLLLL